MPSKITNTFKLVNANSFKETYNPSSSNYLYVFFARPNPWTTADEPYIPEDTQQSLSTLWDEIVSLKKVNYDDISHVIPRINWSKNTTYTEYDNQDPDLLGKNFYVINSELNVYKCIDNFNSSVSVIEPTGKSLSIFRTADGYKWKYLYSISTSDRLKFLTSNWMPVSVDSIVSSNAIDGAIENIKINNGGIDYSINARVEILGDGLSANITTKQSLGVIYDFFYNNVGTGYRFANAFISDPNNSKSRGANIRAVISPVGGHGYNPVAELGAHYLMINLKTEYNEGFGDFPGSFSYRKIGLVKNPKSYSGSVANSLTLNGLEGLQINAVNGVFNIGEYIEGLTSKTNAWAVAANTTFFGNTSGNIRYMQTHYLTSNFKDFAIGERVIGITSGAIATVSNYLQPEVMKDSGDILYIENRDPITRTRDQSDNLHLVLEF